MLARFFLVLLFRATLLDTLRSSLWLEEVRRLCLLWVELLGERWAELAFAFVSRLVRLSDHLEFLDQCVTFVSSFLVRGCDASSSCVSIGESNCRICLSRISVLLGRSLEQRLDCLAVQYVDSSDTNRSGVCAIGVRVVSLGFERVAGGSLHRTVDVPSAFLASK